MTEKITFNPVKNVRKRTMTEGLSYFWTIITDDVHQR